MPDYEGPHCSQCNASHEPRDCPHRAISIAKAKPACASTPEHGAHMALNGECPWCGAVDASKIRDDLTVEQIEEMYG